MRDYTMDLTGIAAGIAAEIMGGSMTANTYYSADGNYAIMEFNGYPLYNGGGKKSKVMVIIPRSTFYVHKGDVHFLPVHQTECRYFQENMSTPLAHPHIYPDGHPCWDGSRRERATDLIANIVETLTLTNVTKDSVTYGRCASGIMGVQQTALDNARSHSRRVSDTLKCYDIVKDRRKLESYISKRWCSKITVLTRMFA